MKAKEFFTRPRLEVLNAAIKTAEKNTSGEIRLYIEDRCKHDVLDRAAFIFEKLDMHRTKLRNGVLFYLAMKDHKFAILGDGGINAKVDDNFWDMIKEQMLTEFSQDRFDTGLEQGILMAGEALSAHFPYQQDDVNELPDDIIVK